MPDKYSRFPLREILIVLVLLALIAISTAILFNRQISALLLTYDDHWVESLVPQLQSLGWAGAAALFVFQVLQVVIAVLPGGGVELAGGILYGSLPAIIISSFGILFGTMIVAALCRRFGKSFVEKMVSPKALLRYHSLLENKKFTAFLLVLFFLPGVPKDVLTYVVGLSGKLTKTYLTQMMLARLPETPRQTVNTCNSLLFMGYSASSGWSVL
jgi:uncharacterized membrane protein YdjX (TVP38/TMEM64 family)